MVFGVDCLVNLLFPFFLKVELHGSLPGIDRTRSHPRDGDVPVLYFRKVTMEEIIEEIELAPEELNGNCDDPVEGLVHDIALQYELFLPES